MTPRTEAPLRIVIADDQASVREGLVMLLGGLPDIEVLGAAADGQEALDLVAELHPDAVLLDLRMPVLDGIETTRRLATDHAEVAIVVLTTYADDSSVLEALRAGARSYLTKDADRADIARALHAAARGLSVLDPGVQATLLAAAAGASAADIRTGAPGTGVVADGRPGAGSGSGAGSESDSAAGPGAALELPDGLTQREAEILGLIARGLTNPEIAAQLFLSSHTIKTHINRIFTKTGSRDRIAAARYAQEHDLG
ncbi:MAG TPA: response regulator transcription factor [Actinocrinis sp.]|nr:response regulator transcription factor [Actinocrinis sp.]